MQTGTFEGLAISTELRRAVQRTGFEVITPIQGMPQADARGTENWRN
jgi:hypothetical protein